MSVSLDLELLTREQAAKYLSCKPQTLAVWASYGRHELPYLKIGRSVRYRRSDLEKWLADRIRTQTE